MFAFLAHLACYFVVYFIFFSIPCIPIVFLFAHLILGEKYSEFNDDLNERVGAVAIALTFFATCVAIGAMWDNIGK